MLFITKLTFERGRKLSILSRHIWGVKNQNFQTNSMSVRHEINCALTALEKQFQTARNFVSSFEHVY